MQNAVGFLSQARHIDVQINSKLEELSYLKALAKKVTTTYQSDMVDGSRDVLRARVAVLGGQLLGERELLVLERLVGGVGGAQVGEVRERGAVADFL